MWEPSPRPLPLALESAGHPRGLPRLALQDQAAAAEPKDAVLASLKTMDRQPTPWLALQHVLGQFSMQTPFRFELDREAMEKDAANSLFFLVELVSCRSETSRSDVTSVFCVLADFRFLQSPA